VLVNMRVAAAAVVAVLVAVTDRQLSVLKPRRTLIGHFQQRRPYLCEHSQLGVR